jgi:hypothetical protein
VVFAGGFLQGGFYRVVFHRVECSTQCGSSCVPQLVHVYKRFYKDFHKVGSTRLGCSTQFGSSSVPQLVHRHGYCHRHRHSRVCRRSDRRRLAIHTKKMLGFVCFS